MVNSNKNESMKNLFIGIDYSKKKFDVSLLEREKTEEIKHECFENTPEGCKAMLKWIQLCATVPMEEWLFCGEHTGLYGVLLTEFLLKKKFFVWIENPMQIKLSAGLKREKNDKVDSQEIARYAYRFQDRARCFQIQDKSLKSLQLLLSFRDRLMRNKHSILVAAQEIRAVLKRDTTARYIYEQTKRDVERLDKEIKDVESRMKEIIQASEELKVNYQLVTSIKGIGLINTVALMIHTDNFARFQNCRQLACYAGVVPFEKTSGSSIKSGSHISHLANIQIKTLLTQAARSAVLYNPELRQYYERKLKEGKLEQVVINNVRNKLLHHIFAIVQKKQPYQVNYINSLNKNVA